MWSELVNLVEKRCREQPACSDAQAHSLVALYGALSSCQIAFDRLEEYETDEAEVDAALAMDTVLETLHTVQPVLGLLQPGRERILTRYVRLARPAADGANAKPMLRQRVALLRTLLALETSAVLEAPILSGFTGARRRMADLISKRCTAEQLFG